MYFLSAKGYCLLKIEMWYLDWILEQNEWKTGEI